MSLMLLLNLVAKNCTQGNAQSTYQRELDRRERRRSVNKLISTKLIGPNLLRLALKEQRELEMDFIRSHPTYDLALYIFRQGNPIRQFCQKLCLSPHGERLFGKKTIPLYESIMRFVVLLAVIASITVAAISTPVYRRNYYEIHGQARGKWFDLTEAGLGLVFVLEFLIKVCFYSNSEIWDTDAILDYRRWFYVCSQCLSEGYLVRTGVKVDDR